MDHQGGEVWVEGLASMDQDDGEEQARLRSMDYEGHMKLQVIRIICEDVKWFTSPLDIIMH